MLCMGRDGEGGSPAALLAQNSGRGAQSNCTSLLLWGPPFQASVIMSSGGDRVHRSWCPSTVWQHSLLQHPWHRDLYSSERRGAAEQFEELGNEEQNHLVQRVYCKFLEHCVPWAGSGQWDCHYGMPPAVGAGWEQTALQELPAATAWTVLS